MCALPNIRWIVVDGLPMWLVDQLITQAPARYPMLSKVLGAGQMVRLLPVSPNCQTPPSLCSLFSGLAPDQHGLTGFDVPDPDDPIATRNAFDAFADEVPMVWDRYAENGQSVALCHLPYVNSKRLKAALRSRTYGFVTPVIEPISIDVRNKVEHHEMPGANIQIITQRHSEGTVAVGTTRMGSKDDVLHLKSGEWIALPLIPGAPALACFCETEGGGQLHILGSFHVTPVGQTPDRIGSRYPFAAGGMAKTFRKGGFGQPMIHGGDGQAEEVLFRGISALSKRYWAEAILAASSQETELTIAYQPAYDLLFHEILGLTDPDNAHYRPERAGIAEKLLADALAEIECGLCAVISAAKGQEVVMCSDHGMKPIDTILCPNVLLKDWGYLQLRNNQIDVQMSQAYFHLAETGALWLSKSLGPSAQEALLDRLVATFSDQTGQECHWFSADIQTNGNDTFTQHLFFAPGKRQTLKAHVDGPAIRASLKTADHATSTDEDSLHGVVAALTHPMALPDYIAAKNVAGTFLREAPHVAH